MDNTGRPTEVGIVNSSPPAVPAGIELAQSLGKVKAIALAALVLFTAQCLVNSRLSAATFTWSSTATGTTWSAASNWGGTTPGAADIGEFAGASYSSQPSLSNAATIGGLWDIGAGAVTISGNALTLMGTNTINGHATTGIEIDAGAGGLTITAPLALANNQQWLNNSTSPITVTGAVSGPVRLTTSGSGTLILTGGNSYSGGTTVSGGTLQIGNAATNGTIGSGTYAISGGARLYLDYATAAEPTWGNFSGAGTVELNSAQAVNGSANWCSASALALGSGFTGTLQVDNGRINNTPSGFGGATSVVINNGGQFLAFDGGYNGTAYNFAQNFSLSGLGWGEGGYNNGALRVSGMNATFSGHMTLTGNTGLFTQNSQNSTMTVSGPISGPYSLAINSYNGPITLSGSNNYSGGTSLSAGQLNIANSAALGNPSGLGLTMAGGNFDNTSGGPLTLANSISQAWNSSFTYVGSANNLNLGAGAVTLGGSITTTVSAHTLTVGGGISGPYGLTKAGAGSLALLGTSSYSGSTTISAGTLQIGGGGLLGNGNYSAAIANSGALVVSTSSNQTFGGVISGSGAVYQLGPGTLTDNAANTFTGVLNVNGGVFATNNVSTAGAAQGMGQASSLTLNGGTFRYTGGNSGTNFAPTVNVGANGGTIDTPSGYLFFGGALSGNGPLTILNSAGLNAAWLLDTGNSPAFSGHIVIGDGVHKQSGIQYRSNAAYPLGTGTITVNSLGLLTADSGTSNPGTLPNNIILNGGTFGTQSANVTYGGAIQVQSNSFVGSPPSLGSPNSTSGVITVLGVISGAATASLTKNTADTAIFAGANTYTGATIVAAGTLKAGVATVGGGSPTSGALGVNSPVAVLGGSTLDLNGYSETIGSLTDSGSLGGTITSSAPGSPILTVGGLGASTTFSGVLQNGSATLGLNVLGPGSLTISGSQNTYSGGTTITSGTLALVSGGTLGGGSITIVPGGVLDTSALASGYTMNAGTLTAGRTTSPATDINGSLSLNNATVLVAGANQVGTMTIGGNLTLNTANFAYNWGSMIAIGGSLNLAGTTSVLPVSVLSPGTATLFTFNGAVPNLADFTTGGVYGSNPRQTYTFGTSGGTAVTLTVVGVAGDLIWTGGTNGIWYSGSGSSANWNNTATGSPDYFGTNDYVIFSDSGSAAPIVSISGSVAPGSLTISNTAVNYTFTGGPITGIASLMKSGPGTLTLAQTNSYGGGTMILGGVIALGASNALPVAGGLILGTSGGSGTFDMAGFNQQLAGLAIGSGAASASQIIGNSAVSSTSTLTYNGSSSTFAGTIQDGINGSGGQVALTLAGGLLNLSGSNTYSGSTTIQGGTLQLGSAAALPAAAVQGLLDNGTLDLAGYNASIGLTGSGTVINSAASATLTVGANNAPGTFTGSLQGSTLNLTKTGSGLFVLTGVNSPGNILISQGTLQVGNGGSTASISSALSIVDNAALAYNFGAGGNPSIAGITGSGSVSAVSPAITINGNITTGGSQSYNATDNGAYLAGLNINTSAVLSASAAGASISLTGDVGNSGNGTALMISTSAGNGPINLNISIGRYGTWYNLSSFTANAGTGAINWNGAYAANNNQSTPITLIGAINFTSNFACYPASPLTMTLDPTAPSSVSGAIGGPVSLVAGGPSSVILTNNDTYTGSTTISGGTLQLGTGMSGHDGAISSTSGVTNNAALVYDLFGNQTVAYTVSGSGSLTTSGPGRLTLTRNNSYTGLTSVTAGTLQLGDGISNNGSVSGNISNNSVVVFANPTGFAFGGVISGSGSLVKGAAGTLYLTGNHSYGGSTAIVAGAIRLGSLGGFGSTGYGYTVNSTTIAGTPVTGDILTLTDGNGGEARSAFYNWPVSPVNGFTASFTYTPSSGNGTADGIAFILQNDPRGTAAIGGDGGSLGYATGNGGTGITHSAAIDLNLYSNVNQTGYDSNGNLSSPTTVNNVNFHSGDPIAVSVTYNSQSQVMAWTLTDAIANTSFSTSQSGVNLQSVLSGSSAYIGFSGGDGGAVSTQTISNFSYTPVPPASNILPAATALTVASGGTLDLYGTSQTVSSLTGGGVVTNSSGSGSLTVGNGNASSTFSGSMQNSAGQLSLTKTGTGMFGLSGNVNLAGTLTVSGGMLGHSTSVVQAHNAVIDGGAYALSGNGRLSWSTSLLVGNSAAGTFTQSGGTNSGNPSGSLYMGYNAGATGTYNLASGLLTAQYEYVGYSGSGSLNQSGGTNTLTGSINVGSGTAASGTYSLSGPALLSAQEEIVGDLGQGSFAQTGGTNTSALFVGKSGSYNITGGWIQNSGAGSTFVVDNLFQQSGGTVNVSNNGFLLLTTSATYNLSGSGQLNSKSEEIGLGGSGVFTQSGGTNSVTGVSFGYTGLILGYNPGDRGTYNLNGGLLNVDALAASSGTAIFNFGGGTLGAVASFSTPLNMTLTGSGGNATIDTTGGNIGLSGLLGGSGGLNKAGNGVLSLSGNNTYLGPTNVSGGTLWISPSGSLASPAINVAAGATLAVTAATNLTGNSITVSPSGVFDTTGAGSGLVLAAGNLLTAGRPGNPGIDINGSLTLAGGTLNVGGSGTAATLTESGNLTLAGGVLAVDIASTSASDLVNVANLNLSGPTVIGINAPGGLLANGNYPLIDYSGTFSGDPAGLSLNGIASGTQRQAFAWIASGSSAGSLALQVSATSAQLVWTGSAGNTWDASSQNWNNGGISDKFYSGDSVTFDDTAATAAIVLNSPVQPQGVLFNNNAMNYTLSGSGGISGSGSLTKNGSGALTLGTSNGYTGGTSINAGLLQAAGNAALGASSGSLTVNAGGTLDVHGYSLIVGALNGGGIIDNLSGSGSLTVGSGNASGTFSGMIQDSFGQLSLVKVGTGVLILSGSNSYLGGTVADGGRLIMNSPSALPAGSNLAVGSGVALMFGSLAIDAPASASSLPMAVPEPAPWVTLSAAVAMFVLLYRRRRLGSLGRKFRSAVDILCGSGITR
jgi:fibronectin-binding autotransporter adhesin